MIAHLQSGSTDAALYVWVGLLVSQLWQDAVVKKNFKATVEMAVTGRQMEMEMEMAVTCLGTAIRLVSALWSRSVVI